MVRLAWHVCNGLVGMHSKLHLHQQALGTHVGAETMNEQCGPNFQYGAPKTLS